MNNKAKGGFYTLWTAAILLCLAVSVFVLIYTSVVGGGGGRRDRAEQAPDPSFTDQAAMVGEASSEPEPSPTPEPTPAPTILAETADQGQAYIDQIVFLGDSTTYGLAAYDVLPFTQIWVPESGTLSLFNCPIAEINYYPPDDPDNPRALSIADCAATGKPEYLVITLGINGIAMLGEDDFKQYYRDVIYSIQEASPDTKIICQSIYPVIDALAPQGINSAGVNAANQWILDLAQETGTRYLNTHDALMDSTGQLNSDFNSGDGIHMTLAGYNAILDYVRTHGYQ